MKTLKSSGAKLFYSITPGALLYFQGERRQLETFSSGIRRIACSKDPNLVPFMAKKKMTETTPLEDDLKLVRYRSSYWVVLEPEGIPLAEFAAKHHDTLGEALYRWMKIHLSRETILQFQESGKFDWEKFRGFMESKGWDISRNEPGIINS